MRQHDDKKERKTIDPSKTNSRPLTDTKNHAPYPRPNNRSTPLSDHKGSNLIKLFPIMLLDLPNILSSTSNENDNFYRTYILPILFGLAVYMLRRYRYQTQPYPDYEVISDDSSSNQLTVAELFGSPGVKSFSSDKQHDDMLETPTPRPTSPLDKKHHTDLLIGTNMTPFLASIPEDERVFLSDEQDDDIWEMRRLSITRRMFDKEYNTNPLAGLYTLNNQLHDKYFHHSSQLAREKIFKQFKRAAQRKSPKAQFNLGDCYRFGIVEKENTEKALYWYRLAAEQGLPSAQVMLGYAYKRGIGVEQDAKQAVHWYRLAADQGSASAQCNLGNCYKNGTGVEKDAKQAMGWYSLAAEQGLARAQLKLGNCYRDGIGTEKDLKAAKKWYLLAANQGIKIAQKYVEQLDYFTAPGKENQNWEQFLQYLHTPAERKTAKSLETNSDFLSMKWYQDAQAGNPVGQYILGCCYEEGIGVKKNAKEAARWYRLAAEHRLPEAQNNFGNYFYNKLGIDKNFQLFSIMMRDDKKRTGPQPNLNSCHQCDRGLERARDAKYAARCYRFAAEQGYAHGQNNLGYCYDYGIGVEQDAKQAVRWYQSAAEQGLAEAQNNLGNCYRDGIGVEQDHKKAFHYYAAAAAQELAEAQANLGDHYESWRDLPDDRKEQYSCTDAHLYQLAAEQGIAHAQMRLAASLFNTGVFMDDTQKKYADAQRYAHLAAEQGYPPAQLRLGLYYADGVRMLYSKYRDYVIEKNITEAMKWWRAAASYDISFLKEISVMNSYESFIETISEEIDTALVKSFAHEIAQFLPPAIQRIIGDYLTKHQNILEATLSSGKRQPQSRSWQQQEYSFFQKNTPDLKSLTTTSEPDAEPTKTNSPSPNG